jgi:hypothetical protein
MFSELPSPPNVVAMWATIWFAVALLHTFLVKRFQVLASKFPDGSVGENLFHLLGEVEVVFGFYSGCFLAAYVFFENRDLTLRYLNQVDFTEPAFVFAIMTVAATRPILQAADRLIRSLSIFISAITRIPMSIVFYFTVLVLGPILGSLITEPAAMTVTALILKKEFYDRGMSTRLKYMTLGLLFVNVSIGGTLTHFAAPPVLMVATKWGWDMPFMFSHFGYKTVLALCISVAITIAVNFRELRTITVEGKMKDPMVPWWVIATHLLFLGLIVLNSHYLVIFMGLFLFFLGVVQVFQEYNDSLKLKEALLVAFFLGGLVILGNQQRWWLEWVLAKLDSVSLFIGAAGLTAITDNAALTYLGAQVPGLSEFSRYALVAGAVTGGGLTVIANAPNPAGYGILSPSFGENGISPLGLLLSALPPTIISAIAYWFLPSV